MKAKSLKKGDVIGVVAPSSPISEKNIEELEKAKKLVEGAGFKVKYGDNIYANTNGYSATALEKAEDINQMFKDKEVKMIWFAKGGQNSNIVFDYLDYEMIKNNPKIICGFSDLTSIINIINKKTDLVTFHGTNFKTIATDENDYGYNEVIERVVNKSLKITNYEKCRTLIEGQAEGKLVGGNLTLIRGLVSGKYNIDFKDKILFIEELGFETSPEMISNHLYYMKQNGVFDNIKGLWIGNYEHESSYSLENIVLDVLGEEYEKPIIKSDDFGHGKYKITIPIGIMARIDTTKEEKIEFIEECVE